MPPASRTLALAVIGLAIAASTADARQIRLRSAGSLRATAARLAGKPVVRLHWRDRARGETRWEVLRGGRRRARLKANRTSYTDRTVRAGRTYTYRVKPCRRRRCAKSVKVRVTVRKSLGSPGVGSPPGATGPDAFAGSPVVGGCPVFPKSNPWNTDISRYPVDRAQSDAYVRSLGAITLWPDFGSGDYGDYGIPFGVVPPTQPLVPITFHVSPEIAAESDPGPYPIPPGARVEGGGVPHVLIVRGGDCKLFELYDATKQPDNS